MCFFFFKQKTAYEMRISDWSSDVCSSDLQLLAGLGFPAGHIHEFNDAGEADRFIDTYPKCYVLKFSGPDFASSDNYVGWSADGRDVEAMLRRRRGVDGTFILMDSLEGIEMGMGAYFEDRQSTRLNSRHESAERMTS